MTFGFWPRGFPPNVFADQASQARADLAAIAEELAVYASMHEGKFPASLETMISAGFGPKEWVDRHGAVSTDPWGNAYAYRTSGDRMMFELLSYGADGRPGGIGEASDLAQSSNVDSR